MSDSLLSPSAKYCGFRLLLLGCIVHWHFFFAESLEQKQPPSSPLQNKNQGWYHLRLPPLLVRSTVEREKEKPPVCFRFQFVRFFFFHASSLRISPATTMDKRRQSDAGNFLPNRQQQQRNEINTAAKQKKSTVATSFWRLLPPSSPFVSPPWLLSGRDILGGHSQAVVETAVAGWLDGGTWLLLLGHSRLFLAVVVQTFSRPRVTFFARLFPLPSYLLS